MLIKKFIYLLLPLLLVFSSTADAAMSCCVNMDTPTEQTQMDSEMPCHEATDNSSDMIVCDGCGCDHCLQISALPIQMADSNDAIPSTAQILFNQSMASSLVEGVFQPPKPHLLTILHPRCNEKQL